jgi:hypothetical protein
MEMEEMRQIAQARAERRWSLEDQFAEQYPELWEEICAELQKFDYYFRNSQRIEDDPEFCEQAIEDLGLHRETLEEFTDTPEDFRGFVLQMIEHGLSRYCEEAARRGVIEWGRVSWSPDTGLRLRETD